MFYCRHYMVTTRAFIVGASRTVITHPTLIPSAFRLYKSTRARRSRGIFRLLPSRRYLAFRLYTQYGTEEVEPSMLREDIAKYLNWARNSK